jgi:hypothetical protein
MQPLDGFGNCLRMDPEKPNSPLSRAQHALEVARQEVDEAATTTDDQPRLEQALDETAEALDDHQAALNNAAEADQADDEDSGKAEAERRAWAPLPPGR